MLKSAAIVPALIATVALGGCDTPRGREMATDAAGAGFDPLVGAAVGDAAGATIGAATH